MALGQQVDQHVTRFAHIASGVGRRPKLGYFGLESKIYSDFELHCGITCCFKAHLMLK